MLYQPNPVQPKQEYIDAYDKLSEKKKRKYFESKIIDRKTFHSMQGLFRMRDLGFKGYFKISIEKNEDFKDILILRLIVPVMLFLNFQKIKMKYIWNIVKKGYTPKGVYFRYAVLSDESLDTREEKKYEYN